jgi:hypothetical protein
MAYNPRNWVLGRDLTALTIYTGVRDATTGVVTWTSAGSLLNQVDYIRLSDTRMLDMIASVDATFAHYEKTLNDSSLVVGEILQKPTAPILPAAAATKDYLKVVFTRSNATYTYLGIIESFADGISALGKNAVEVTLKPIDLGSSSQPIAVVLT